MTEVRLLLGVRSAHAGTPDGILALGALHRQAASLRLGADTEVRTWTPVAEAVASSMTFEVAYLGRNDPSSLVVDVGALAAQVKSVFAGHVFSTGQQAAIEFDGGHAKLRFKLTCTGYDHVDMAGSGPASAGAAPAGFGQLVKSSEVRLSKAKDATFKVKGGTAG